MSAPLERAWVKHRLIRELALGDKTQAALAEQYGVTPGSITIFKQRHHTAIEDVRADLLDEFASLWIAKKVNRVAEYQDDVDKLSDSTETDVLKVKHAALKAVAEELGQLPSRYGVSVGSASITYKIEGVDLDKLK